MTTKEAFLARLRQAHPGAVPRHRPVVALADVPEVVLRDEPDDEADLVEVLGRNLALLDARLHRTSRHGLAATVASVIGQRGPVLLDERSADLAGGVEHLSWPSCGLDAAARATVGLVPARAAVATTGSVVLDSDLAGRLVSLLPAVVVPVVPAAAVVRRLGDVLRRPERWWPDGLPTNVVVLTGPSRSADIEMRLVVDVHGPGEVDVIVVDES